MWDLSETEMKAYTVFADFSQNDSESKDNNSETIKRTKSKSKKQKVSKLKVEEIQELNQEVLNGDGSSGSSNDPLDLITNDDLFDVDDDDESHEFNVIYFMMKTPNKVKKRFP